MEDEIRKLLHEAAPTPSDPAAFRLELNARLSAAEQIKAYRDREYCRNRRTLCAVFAAGMLAGAALAVLLILHPVNWPEPAVPAWLAALWKSTVPTIDPESLLPWLPAALVLSLLAIVLPLSLTRRQRSRLLKF